jgi:hypothetical protein
MRFPTTEAEIRALAQSIIAGLEGNANFPSPPFSAAQLQALLDTVIQRSDAQVLSQAAAKQDTDSKQASISDMAAALKSVLRYAENAAHGEDTLLSQLGWGGRAASHALQAPGQSRLLEVTQQGTGWVTLDWKKPADGGAAASYKIERRGRAEGDWKLAGISVETEITLNNQERGKEWEYRVLAINKAGEGAPSNIVTAVL